MTAPAVDPPPGTPGAAGPAAPIPTGAAPAESTIEKAILKVVKAEPAGKGEPAAAPSGELPFMPRDVTPRGVWPLPGERVAALGDGQELPMAKPRPAPTPPPKVLSRPKLGDQPMWPAPEEAQGRRFLATMVMLCVVGLYAWMLSTYYGGAHGGVDQAGYLMTARLIAGEYNVDAPRTAARPTPAKADVPAKEAPAIWQGGATEYVAEVHPRPASIQANPAWDWLRNRLSYVPSSPFEFSSRMCVITEPFGPASPDVPAAGNKPAVTGKPAEYRVYAKYPWGFSLLAAMGREVAGIFEKQALVMPVARVAAVAPAKGAGGVAASGPEAVGPATGTGAAGNAPVATGRGVVAKDTGGTPVPRQVPLERVGRGLDGIYMVNPLCTVLACFFAYFMFRQAVSSFMALIGVIWLACNPLVLVYANDANSHASSLFCVCVGFWGLLSFLRTQKLWRAWIGGLALGYCCTIRYAELLLVLPVVFAALIHFRFTWKRALGSLSLLAAWAVPVAVLAFTCWIAFGSPTKTGYTYCNEDTGFGWKYLTGYWEDRVLTGNWETLVVQINHIGLFMMWPLALAGLMGMVGSAWRLGVTIALWVVPSMTLYMMYYWAPGNDQTTAYLRFYVTVMPGLIFAGVWLLDRALSHIPGEKRAGLAIGTLLAVFLLVATAIFADGGPEVIDGGLGKMIGGMFTQIPQAVWHLFTQSKMGLGCAGVILAAAAGMWLFDQEVIASRLGVALGAGAITALGCAINLETIMPSVERNYFNQAALRVTVDNLRETLPRGTVIICDDAMLQQLDCIGGWKLYNASAFSSVLYNQSIVKLSQKNSPERMDDPDPIQIERSQFYKELLTVPSSVPTISLGVRPAADLLSLERAVIDKNLEMGHRVVFLVVLDSGDAGITGPGAGGFGSTMREDRIPDGYEKHVLRKWTVSAPPSGPVTQGAAAAFGVAGARGGRGGRGGALRGNTGAGIGALLGGGGTAPARQGPTYAVIEVVKPAPRTTTGG